MDLKFLIPSRIRRRVLRYFVENPAAEISIRKLARVLEEAPQTIHRELIRLEGWGMLFSRARGNERAFRLNKKFPLYPPIVDLFRRYQEEQERTYEVENVFQLNDFVKRAQKVPVPSDLVPGLTAKRKKPRAYEEEKILKKLKKQ